MWDLRRAATLLNKNDDDDDDNEIFSMGINCMSLAVWLVEDRNFCGCSRFSFAVRIIYGTAVFIKTVF